MPMTWCKGGWKRSSLFILQRDGIHEMGNTANRERHSMTNGHRRVQDELEVMIFSFHRREN